MKRLELTAGREGLDELAALVQEECRRRGVSREDLLALQLICDELASNIFRHAYGEGAGTFEFSIDFRDDRCVLEFVDSGPPFDPTDREPPDTTASIADRDIGGLGIFFVQRAAGRFEYERRGDRNVVTVTRKVSLGRGDTDAPEPPGPEAAD